MSAHLFPHLLTASLPPPSPPPLSASQEVSCVRCLAQHGRSPGFHQLALHCCHPSVLAAMRVSLS